MTTDTVRPDTEPPAAPPAEEALAEAPTSLLQRLERAQERYREIVVRASDGDPEAGAEARALEIQISSLIEEARREALARELRRREALAEQERLLREQRDRDRQAYHALLGRRQGAFTLARTRLAGFAQAVQDLWEVEVEAEASALAGPAEERFVSEKQSLSDCVGVVGRELGLSDPPVSWVPAGQRKRLLDRFPDLLDLEATPESETSSRCSVCSHQQRAAIDAALNAGTSYRDVEAAFGVSRSALARHKQHLARQELVSG